MIPSVDMENGVVFSDLMSSSTFSVATALIIAVVFGLPQWNILISSLFGKAAQSNCPL